MRARKTTPANRQWPFWVLLAAWVCANSPQVAVYTALTWLAEARSFSHQGDLTRQVAQLLGGEEATSRAGEAMARMEMTEKAKGEDAKGNAPLRAPTVVVLKKVDLAAEVAARVVPPEARGIFGWESENTFGVVRQVAPPHGPPRSAA